MLNKTFLFFVRIYVKMYNNMGSKIKFTEKEKEIIINLYSKGHQVSEIIELCDFSVSKQTIYNVLNEKKIPLFRKTTKNYDNLIDKTFGHLKLIKIAQTEKSGKYHRWRAICNCDCGEKNVDIAIHSLGKTNSCGCDKTGYLKITGKNNSRFTGHEDISGRYWGRIKESAKTRNFEFNITIDYAWDLFLNQNKECALSGLPIKFSFTRNKNDESASLDRIDSKLGYVEGNVQWVH